MLGHECKELGPDCQEKLCPAKYTFPYIVQQCKSMTLSLQSNLCMLNLNVHYPQDVQRPVDQE